MQRQHFGTRHQAAYSNQRPSLSGLERGQRTSTHILHFFWLRHVHTLRCGTHCSDPRDSYGTGWSVFSMSCFHIHPPCFGKQSGEIVPVSDANGATGRCTRGGRGESAHSCALKRMRWNRVEVQAATDNASRGRPSLSPMNIRNNGVGFGTFWLRTVRHHHASVPYEASSPQSDQSSTRRGVACQTAYAEFRATNAKLVPVATPPRTTFFFVVVLFMETRSITFMRW